MPSTKNKKSKNNKLLKINVSSGSDSDDSEHELSYYLKDKVRLMKEVLKLIKPKKIKSMAPDCIKNLDIVEINSMLLEELLGISNKRLQYIFNGENVDRETSSSESEEEKQPIDVISLDDISDDDDIELCISQNEKDSLETGLSKRNKKHKSNKIKTEPPDAIVKSEKSRKENKRKSRKATEPKTQSENAKGEEENLMSVLELLELQARARAIRSQLAIETEKKAAESTQKAHVKQEEASDSDAVIIDSPQRKEIVITSSESEGEGTSSKTHTKHRQNSSVSNLATETPGTSSCPRKKQKTRAKQDERRSNFNQQEDVDESTTINLVNTDDETESASETHREKGNLESDNKKRKEKLLAKLQKIKLVRSKVATNTEASTEINVASTTTNDGSDVTVTSAVEACTENSEMSTINGVANENLPGTARESVDLETQNASFEDKKDTEAPSIKINEDLEAVESIISKEGSPQDTPKPINPTYCDNDEIVINVDEDEMDGIENV